MTKGTLYPAESRCFADAQTGASIRQITSHPSIHHHPFFMIGAYDDAMQRLIFTSERTGKPQLFAELRATGELLQLTDRADLNDWSIHPARNGRHVYYTAGTGGWRIDLETLAEEQLVDFCELALNEDAVAMREAGMVAAAMGTTALSANDRYWAVKVTVDDSALIVIVDAEAGKHEVILRRDTVAHMQFCPDDDRLLFYAGPLTDRVWVINRDGSGNRRLYRRSAGEWITHETWIPGTRELAITDWPHGVRAIHVETGAMRQVTQFNAWHPVCNRQGTCMVADTNFPDIGLQLFDPLDGIGEPHTLCFPAASSMGDHWNGPFPYENGPIAVYAPQHTHPHPSFSPDGRLIVYTSDQSGHAHLYEVTLPE